MVFILSIERIPYSTFGPETSYLTEVLHGLEFLEALLYVQVKFIHTRLQSWQN